MPFENFLCCGVLQLFRIIRLLEQCHAYVIRRRNSSSIRKAESHRDKFMPDYTKFIESLKFRFQWRSDDITPYVSLLLDEMTCQHYEISAMVPRVKLVSEDSRANR